MARSIIAHRGDNRTEEDGWAFDGKGDINRERFLVEVKGGKQVAVETLPPLRKK